MKRARVGLVTLAIALLGVSVMVSVSAAQPETRGAPTTPAADINFSPNLVGHVRRSLIPTNPPIESWRLTAEGSAAPLGKFDYVSNLTVHFGIDGKPLSITDGVGAFTGDADNNRGDAIFFTLSGVFQRGDNGKFDAVFIVTGGTGRFAGLFGSGRIEASADISNNSFVGAWDGTVKNPIG